MSTPAIRTLKDQALGIQFSTRFSRFLRTDAALAAEAAKAHSTSGGICKVNRNLFPDCDAPLKAVLDDIEKARTTHERHSVPWGLIRAVRIEFYPRHRDATKAALGQFDVSLKAFHDAYPTMVAQGLRNSNGLADPAEYMPQDEIYSRFSISLSYHQLTDAADWLKASMIGPAEQAELVAQTKLADQQNLAGMKDSLKDQFCKILSGARDNLAKTVTPNKTRHDGSKFRFNVGWLIQLQQFCELWPGFNMDSDPLVPIMLADLAPILKHSPETLKTSDQAKAECFQTLESFIATHDAWLNG